jgi:hypothetical protein
LLLASLFSRGRKINSSPSCPFLSLSLSPYPPLFAQEGAAPTHNALHIDTHTERERRRRRKKKEEGIRRRRRRREELLEEVASASPMGWKKRRH